MPWLDEVDFNADGLVPVIAQDARTGSVLMLAYANREALEHTIDTGRAHYWSRSRSALWAKGETSGNTQEVVDLRIDCDGDAILYLVKQSGPACHTLEPSCFFRAERDGELEKSAATAHILARVEQVIGDRQANPKEGSYTNYLLSEGLDKILKKVGEETTEVVIAAKNGNVEEMRSEMVDLLYHLVVMLKTENVPLEDVWMEMDRRFGRAPRKPSGRVKAPAP